MEMSVVPSPKFKFLIMSAMFDSKVDQNGLTNILKIFFEFAYYLAICPFKIVERKFRLENEIKFEKFVWKPQMVTLISNCIWLNAQHIFMTQ